MGGEGGVGAASDGTSASRRGAGAGLGALSVIRRRSSLESLERPGCPREGTRRRPSATPRTLVDMSCTWRSCVIVPAELPQRTLPELALEAAQLVVRLGLVDERRDGVPDGAKQQRPRIREARGVAGALC
jgi:hypothetical protein